MKVLPFGSKIGKSWLQITFVVLRFERATIDSKVLPFGYKMGTNWLQMNFIVLRYESATIWLQKLDKLAVKTIVVFRYESATIW